MKKLKKAKAMRKNDSSESTSDSIGDSIGDSSDERNQAIVEDVFEKFSKDGLLSRGQFVKIMIKLSDHVPELRGFEFKKADLAFNLFASSKYMTLLDFKKWWCSSDKFSYFIGKKSRLLTRAYSLYTRYSLKVSKSEDLRTSIQDTSGGRYLSGQSPGGRYLSEYTSSLENESRKMTLKEFTKLLEDIKIAEGISNEIEDERDVFDNIDTDGDGVLSFKEFCAWLNWF